MDRHDSDELQFVTIHGHRRAFIKKGSGPALLLLHGLGCDHTTWAPVIDTLARRHTVIAPDLLGHGQSDKPRADYSVGGYANAMRDLLAVLDVESATIVGHSFGGGVALQFAYQFPELTERLVLVASGGFGPEVTPLIRLVTTPGFHQVAGLLTLPGPRHLGSIGLRILARSTLRQARDLAEAADVFESFADSRTRAAVGHVARAVVDWRGQVITMTDRAYLTADVPTCVVWGADDSVIPASHASVAAAVSPGARVEVLPNAGHFPHKDHPERFARVITNFLRTTSPARHDRATWRDHLHNGGSTAVQQAEAGQAPIEALPSA